MEAKTKSRFLEILDRSWPLLLALVLLLHGLYTWRMGWKIIDSDTTAELILGRVLAAENSVVTDNFYYSTELQIFSINLLYALGWKFFHTFKAVRLFGQMLGLVLLFFAQRYAYKKMKLRYVNLYAFVLLLPFSWLFFNFVQFGLYYLSYFSFCFWLLGLSQGRRMRERAAYLLVAFLAGLSGMRLVCMYGLPAFGSACLIVFFDEKCWKMRNLSPRAWSRDSRNRLLWNTGCLVCMGAGVLAAKYMMIQLGVNEQKLTLGPEAFKILQLGIAALRVTENFGILLDEQGRLGLLAFVCAIVMEIVVVCILVRMLQKQRDPAAPHRDILWITCLANLEILVIQFLDGYPAMKFTGRYWMTTLFYVVPLVAVYMDSCEEEGNFAKAKKWLGVLLSAAFCMQVVCNTAAILRKNYNQMRIDMADTLVQNGYTVGYSTFWCANVLEELTEGALELKPVNGSDFLDNKWLTPRNDFITDASPVFFIMSQPQYDGLWERAQAGKGAEFILQYERMIYNNEEYIAYRFENVDEYIDCMKAIDWQYKI